MHGRCPISKFKISSRDRPPSARLRESSKFSAPHFSAGSHRFIARKCVLIMACRGTLIKRQLCELQHQRSAYSKKKAFRTHWCRKISEGSSSGDKKLTAKSSIGWCMFKGSGRGKRVQKMNVDAAEHCSNIHPVDMLSIRAAFLFAPPEMAPFSA